jgi:hypothetical protein
MSDQLQAAILMPPFVHARQEIARLEGRSLQLPIRRL